MNDNDFAMMILISWTLADYLFFGSGSFLSFSLSKDYSKQTNCLHNRLFWTTNWRSACRCEIHTLFSVQVFLFIFPFQSSMKSLTNIKGCITMILWACHWRKKQWHEECSSRTIRQEDAKEFSFKLQFGLKRHSFPELSFCSEETALLFPSFIL